jgi:hypothetical protein
MRTTKELLQIMLDNQHLFINGLCGFTELLFLENKVTSLERLKLLSYIRRNRPPMLSSMDCLRSQLTSGYYWKKGEIEPRIKWIKKHINEIRNI